MGNWTYVLNLVNQRLDATLSEVTTDICELSDHVPTTLLAKPNFAAGGSSPGNIPDALRAVGCDGWSG
jgi:hypothetical protein